MLVRDVLVNDSYTITIVALLLIVWLGRVTYSIFLSPLKNIPSPLFYQFFPWYYDLEISTGDTPFVLNELHKEYGPIFRAGWNVVLIVTPEASQKIYSGYEFSKGRFYNSMKYFGENLLSDRSRHGHALRKRLVAPAFTKANVKLMEPVVNEVGLMPLLTNMENHVKLEKPIDLFHQFHYMSWDIIGELGFGHSFKMLQTGNHPAVEWLASTLNFAMFFYVFPFLAMFKVKAGEKLRKFNDEILDKYYERMNEGKAEHSLLRFLVNAKDKITGKKLSRQEIFAETHLMLFAGTDTTSNCLTLLFYLLMRNPEVEKKLVNELLSLEVDIITNDICRDCCPYLDAVIKEAMRLIPPVGITLLRHVPSSGTILSGYFLPGGTAVGVPIYAIHRSELIWPRANEFLPERWLETDLSAELYVTPEMQKSFMPFLLGPYACVGKNLAQLEINIITANLLKRYKFTTRKSDDSQRELEWVALPVTRPRQGHLTVDIVRRHPS